MTKVTYAQVLAPEVQTKVRGRYANDARALEALGFRELCFYSEQLRRYSLILNLPMIVLMKMSGEVLSLHAGLRVGASYVLFGHGTPPTIALPLGLGVKLYTGFQDGTLIVTTTFKSMAVTDQRQPIYKGGGKLTLEQAWQLHRQRVDHAVKIGKTPKPADSYDAFVQFARHEDGSMSGQDTSPRAST